jgi:hypothetical protein
LKPCGARYRATARTPHGLLPTMNMLMKSPHSPAVARASEPPVWLSLPTAFGDQLSTLYQLVQRSSNVFGSPLGPISTDTQQLYLPRFVYFGPNAADTALRLSFIAGFDHRDLRSTLALLRLIEGLALQPDLGQGLSLSFFPLLDVLGLARGESNRALSTHGWLRPSAPEIGLLEKDARVRSYHGFIRLESGSNDDVIVVRLRSPLPIENFAPSLELISSDDLEPFAVRWESDASGDLTGGPLSMADDLPLQPFELTVRIPASWSLDLYAEAAASILKRFVIRYRGFISYAQHL